MDIEDDQIERVKSWLGANGIEVLACPADEMVLVQLFYKYIWLPKVKLRKVKTEYHRRRR